MKMTIYKTYQKAKIANPNCDIYSHNKKFTPSNGNSLHPDVCGLQWTKCEPANHCMSVEEFLNKGFRFKRGDKFLSPGFDVITVSDVDACNTQDEYDENRYVLSAASLDAHLGIADSNDWKNGDECVISAKSKSKWFVVGVSPITETSTVCVSNTGELKSFHTHHLKKPEIPQQREERERLEAAYDLLKTAYPMYDDFDSFKDDETGSRDSWLAIVDKTGYRKEK